MRVAKLVPLLVVLIPLAAAGATVNVSVTNFAFTPSTVNIAPGDTVQWNFSSTHTSTSDVTSAEVWDSTTKTSGQTFSHTFNNAGTFGYHCTIHPFMTGSVHVTAVPPTLASVTPNVGSSGGGTNVTLTGTGFASGCTVDFGGAAGTGVIVANATTMTATTPAHAVGTVNVTVTCTGGSAVLTNGFTFNTAPAITSVTPSTALPGATITINGGGFVSGATVTIGGVASPTVTFVNANTLQAVVPNLAIGPAAIVVTNPSTLSASFAGFAVTSLAVPALSSVAIALLALALAAVAIVLLRR